MKLLTKEILKKATAQYELGSELEDQMIIAKFFDPVGSWSWYLMNIDPKDNDYAWGIVKGNYVEMGSWLMSELETLERYLGFTIERDLSYEPKNAKDEYDRLKKEEPVHAY
jgi:hypothetical protein